MNYLRGAEWRRWDLHVHTPGTQKNGNYEASLSALCMLLEHVLRAAIINDEDTGMNRTDSASHLNKYDSLTKAIAKAESTHLMDGCDIEWWKAVSRVVRNKTAHYVLPILLKKCAEEEKLRKYLNNSTFPA